jgi:diacylglycerol kinase
MNGSAWFFEFTKSEYIICCILSALIFAAELMNTAIESTVDLVSLDSNELAKIAKDCAAGAVLILAICAIIVWGMIVVSHW